MDTINQFGELIAMGEPTTLLAAITAAYIAIRDLIVTWRKIRRK